MDQFFIESLLTKTADIAIRTGLTATKKEGLDVIGGLVVIIDIVIFVLEKSVRLHVTDLADDLLPRTPCSMLM